MPLPALGAAPSVRHRHLSSGAGRAEQSDGQPLSFSASSVWVSTRFCLQIGMIRRCEPTLAPHRLERAAGARFDVTHPQILHSYPQGTTEGADVRGLVSARTVEPNALVWRALGSAAKEPDQLVAQAIA
jgi:hypothetical protein